MLQREVDSELIATPRLFCDQLISVLTSKLLASLERISTGMNVLVGILNFFSPRLNTDLSDDAVQEFHKLTNFKPKEIARIRRVFRELTEGSETLSKETFLQINCIAISPLSDRISLVFGYEKGVDSLDFKGFLCGLAQFNSPGMREQKMRVAYRIQDFDGDGQISKGDLTTYMERITANSLSASEIEEVVAEVFRETASDSEQNFISFSDFQRVVAQLDFQAKLQLSI